MAGLPENRLPTSMSELVLSAVHSVIYSIFSDPTRRLRCCSPSLRSRMAMLWIAGSLLSVGCETEETTTRTDTFFCQTDLGSCGEVLVSVIAGATNTIEGAIYSLTLTEVAEALVSAVDRGVQVWIVYESDQVKDDMIDILQKGGVFLRADGNSAAMHHKFLVADGKVVANGSFNWTNNANYNNDENLQVIYSSDIASLFSVEFLRLWEAAVQ
ncbi:MAG: hypothetical protein HUU55_05970 [Myxococcales bacterium]|nr:hypothetical protein [Myxococcales bacterium]